RTLSAFNFAYRDDSGKLVDRTQSEVTPVAENVDKTQSQVDGTPREIADMKVKMCIG
ncbi:hypothetical protein L195_g037574, partial [Trifolium pratense]